MRSRALPIGVSMLLWAATSSCGLFGASGGIDITVEVDATALQRICRTGGPVCWPGSRDEIKAVVFVTATEVGTGKAYSEKVGERAEPGTMTFLLEGLPDGDYRLEPYTVQPPDWGQIGFEPEQRRVLFKSGSGSASFTLKEVQDLPCWGTDGELEGRGCGVGAEW